CPLRNNPGPAHTGIQPSIVQTAENRPAHRPIFAADASAYGGYALRCPRLKAAGLQAERKGVGGKVRVAHPWTTSFLILGGAACLAAGSFPAQDTQGVEHRQQKGDE